MCLATYMFPVGSLHDHVNGGCIDFAIEKDEQRIFGSSQASCQTANAQVGIDGNATPYDKDVKNATRAIEPLWGSSSSSSG